MIDLTDGNDNVVDLTVDKAPSPKTSTVNTSINIYSIAAKRRKKEAETRSKTSGSSLSKLPRVNEIHHTKDNNLMGSGNKEAPDFGAIHSLVESGSSCKDTRPTNAANSVNGDAHDSMDTSDSQRPVLTRFQHLTRFTRKKANGFISARTRNTPLVSCLQ